MWWSKFDFVVLWYFWYRGKKTQRGCKKVYTIICLSRKFFMHSIIFKAINVGPWRCYLKWKHLIKVDNYLRFVRIFMESENADLCSLKLPSKKTIMELNISCSVTSFKDAMTFYRWSDWKKKSEGENFIHQKTNTQSTWHNVCACFLDTRSLIHSRSSEEEIKNI